MVGGCAHLILAIGSVLLLNVSCFTGDEDYTCVHDDTPPSPDEVYHADTGEKQRSARTLGDSFLPIRIHVHYDGSINKQLLPRATTFLRNDLIPAVTAEFRLTLRVRRTPGPIRLSRNCVDSSVSHVNKVAVCTRGCKNDTHCVHVLVPPAHLRKCPVSDTSSTGSEGKGVGDADFLLYVSALNTSACKQNAIAEALHCQLEPDLDRPVAGNVNLCPGQLAGPSFKLTEWKLAVTHELTHALGFSRRLFPFFRDVGGEPLTPRSSFGHPAIADGYYVIGERVVKEVTRTNWMVRSGVVTRTVSMLVTPAVKAEVRRHFNCVTLEGAELENQGSSGSSLSHLEKRVFENELMTAVQTPGPVLSRISLAVLQDTGWYVVNYSRAGPLAWGKGLGCDFVTKSCMEWMETKRAKGEPIMPYCDDGKPQYCSLDGSKVLECNIYKYDHELPKQFQNYAKVPGYKDRESAKFGSIITAADFCAYPTEFYFGKRNSNCKDASNNKEPRYNEVLEKYGPRSRCFTHGDKWQIFDRWGKEVSPNTYGSGCYQYTCDPAGSLAKYTVNIMGKLYECNTTGGLVDVNVKSDAFRGTGRLVCVAYEDVCVSKTTSASRKSATSAGGLQVAYDCSSAWAVDRLRARCLPMDLETRTVSPTTGVARGSGSTRYLLTALIRTIVVTFFFALAFADVLISL